MDDAPPVVLQPFDSTPGAWAAAPARALVTAVKSACQRQLDQAASTVLTGFYERYSRYVLKVANSVLGVEADPAVITEVVHDTFMAFWEHADKFDVDRTPTDETCDANVRTYLARRARWIAGNRRALERSCVTVPVETAVLARHIAETVETETPDVSVECRRTAEWLATLTPREQDVLRAYFVDCHSGQKSERLPEHVVQRLCQDHGVTPSALRHMKRKLVTRLRQHLVTNA